jgi:peroxiredoxin
MGYLKSTWVCAKIFIIVLIFFNISCAKYLDTVTKPGFEIPKIKPPVSDENKSDQPDVPPQEELFYFQGIFQTSDGKWVELNNKILKPTVIIFSQESCMVCRKEAKALVEHFKKMGKQPSNIDLYTLLTSAYLEDTENFKKDLEISWTVGLQESDDLFKAYCPANKVPCVIVQTPARGYVFQNDGRVYD